MKVLQITTNYPCKENPVFGIFMKEQVESLEPLGVENTIFFSNGLKSNPNKKLSAKRIHMLSAVRLFFHLLTHHYDVIHCHSVVSGLILRYSGWASFKKCVLSLQNDPRTQRGTDRHYFDKLYKYFNKVIVKLPVHTDLDKIEYIPNGVNTSFFHPMDKTECKRSLGLDVDKRYVLFVDSNSGKKRTQKRKDRFDGVMALLKTTYGHEDLEELVMVGVERNMVPIYMNACDLHLLTSDEEGSPNSVKECMACNVPCVTTPVGNVADLFEGINDCKYSSSFEIEELAVIAHKVLSENRKEQLDKVIIDKGLDDITVATKIKSLYDGLIADK